MRNVNGKITVILIVLGLMLNQAVNAAVPSNIEIAALQASIKVGEPVVMKLSYRFNEPVISSRTNDVQKEIFHNAHLRVQRGQEDGSTIRYRLSMETLRLRLEGSEGLEYSGRFLIFYNYGWHKLVFDKPGTYTLEVEGWTKTSNPLNIKVQPPSMLEEQALSLLSDPNDYYFLIYGRHEYAEKRPERISHLRQVADRCEGTLLARWAAARLGIEKSRELQEKYPAGEKFKADYNQGKITEPLFEQAYTYLSEALTLPNEFPVREEVLSMIISAEIVRGDYQKAVSYAKEMGEKYPTGEYGKRSLKIQDEILEFWNRESDRSREAGRDLAPLAYVLITAAIAIGIGGLILLLKKKSSSCGK